MPVSSNLVRGKTTTKRLVRGAIVRFATEGEASPPDRILLAVGRRTQSAGGLGRNRDTDSTTTEMIADTAERPKVVQRRPSTVSSET